MFGCPAYDFVDVLFMILLWMSFLRFPAYDFVDVLFMLFTISCL